MKYLNSKLFYMLLLATILLFLNEIQAKTYSSSSYRSTSYSSYSSGSRSSGKWTMSTENWIIISVCTVGGFWIIFIWLSLCIICWKRMNTISTNNKYKAIQIRQENELLLKIKQKEEATRLERMQLEMENTTNDNMYSEANNSFLISHANQNQPNVLVLPGQSVQPSYVDVNPYSGHYNNSVVPVMYNKY